MTDNARKVALIKAVYKSHENAPVNGWVEYKIPVLRPTLATPLQDLTEIMMQEQPYILITRVTNQMSCVPVKVSWLEIYGEYDNTKILLGHNCKAPDRMRLQFSPPQERNTTDETPDT